MSFNLLIWNVRGIVNTPTRNIIKRLIKLYNVGFLGIIEPFTQPDLELYTRVLGLEFKGSNNSGKIWIFTEKGVRFDVVDDS